MESKCVMLHCRDVVGYEREDKLCRNHQMQMLMALHKHLSELLTVKIKRAWLKTPQGKSWLMDWVRLQEGIHRHDQWRKG